MVRDCLEQDRPSPIMGCEDKKVYSLDCSVKPPSCCRTVVEDLQCSLNNLTLGSSHSGTDRIDPPKPENSPGTQYLLDAGACSDINDSAASRADYSDQPIDADTLAGDCSIGYDAGIMGIRRRHNECKESPGRRGRGGTGNLRLIEKGSDEIPLLRLDDLIGEFYRLHKEKEREKPYNTTKIANMWRALWPPSMQTLCEEVEMDGWVAVPRELLNVTKNSVEEIIEIISFSGYPGVDRFIDIVSDIGMPRLRVCHSATNKLILRSGGETSSKCVVFWACTFASLWSSRLHLTCFVVAIF